MRLTDDELRAVLARAEDLQGSSRRIGGTDAEMQRFIESAEEIGFDRAAVEQALREQMGLPLIALKAGDLVFAKSADSKSYVAEVLSAAGDQHRVRFLRGGEHLVGLDDIRACSFLPGQRVVCPWPWWGPWTCIVESYDAAAKQVTVSDGWAETRTFQISEVWLDRFKVSGKMSTARKHITRAIVAAGFGVGFGALLGSIVTSLFMR
jgi:hypothetical protein